MQLAVAREALDRRHLQPVRLYPEDGAGLDRLAVDQHGAGAAGRGVAADVGAGEAEPLAQDRDEQLARLELEIVRLAVHRERDSSQQDRLLRFRRNVDSSLLLSSGARKGARFPSWSTCARSPTPSSIAGSPWPARSSRRARART